MTERDNGENRLRQALHRTFDPATPSPDFEARVTDTVGSRPHPWGRVSPWTVWGIAGALVVGIGLGTGVALRGAHPGSGPAGSAGVPGAVATGSPSASLSTSPSPGASPSAGTATGRPSSAPTSTSPIPQHVQPTALPDGTPPCNSADVMLTLRTDQATYTGVPTDQYGGTGSGQPITFIVTVTNISNHPCALVSAYATATGGPEPYMACVDLTAATNGRDVYHGDTDRPCPKIASRIEPGATETASHTWNQGQCHTGRCVDTTIPAPAGHYTARAQFLPGGWYESVPQATTTFDITPPPSPSPTTSPAPTPSPSPTATPSPSPS